MIARTNRKGDLRVSCFGKNVDCWHQEGSAARMPGNYSGRRRTLISVAKRHRVSSLAFPTLFLFVSPLPHLCGGTHFYDRRSAER